MRVWCVPWFHRSLITLTCILGFSVLTSRYVIAQSGLTELLPAGPTMPPVVPGASPWGEGVKLAAIPLDWVSDYGLRTNIDSKISELKPKIDAAMPTKGGVLIVIGISQSAQPGALGNYVRWVLDGYIGGTGTTPKEAMEKYLTKDRQEQGASRGFVRRNVYLWKASTQAKVKYLMIATIVSARVGPSPRRAFSSCALTSPSFSGLHSWSRRSSQRIVSGYPKASLDRSKFNQRSRKPASESLGLGFLI